MILRQHFINKLRELNYKYKTRQKRTELWRQAGTGKPMSVPLRDLIDEEFVAAALRMAGLTAEEVARFIASCKS